MNVIKGQLNSKCPLGVFKATEKPNKFFVRTSALANTNRKSSARDSKYYHPISGIKRHYFFLFDLFLEARAEILAKFCWFFGQFEDT